MDAVPSTPVSLVSRDGFVLPTVVFAVAIMSIVVVATLSTSSDERRASRAVRESTLAEYAAEAGLRQTFGAWPSNSVSALNAGDSLDLGWQTLPNSAKYRTVIHRVDKGGLQLQQYDVVVQGRRTGLNGGMRTIIGVVGGVPTFTYGVYAKTNVSLSGGGLIDAYDSEESLYNPATPDSLATVWSNGNLDIQKTTVLGDVSAAGAIAVGQNVSVSGATTSGVAPAPAMDINACPSGGFTNMNPLPVGVTYIGGVLTVSAGAVVTLTAAQYYFKSIVLLGNASLNVNPPAGSRVEVFVNDSLNLSGGSVTNGTVANPGSPTRLGFSSCGTPPNPVHNWTLTGGSTAAFSIYAPDHPVIVTGGGDVYGAIVGSSYSATGGAKLHYDEALARIPSKKLIVQKATWSELPGN